MPRVINAVGHGLVKILGIKLEDPRTATLTSSDSVTRLKDRSLISVPTTNNFLGGHPTSADWLDGQLPTKHEAGQYLRSLFPFLTWLPHYNVTWLAGDVIAGITIGAIVVPQGMAYAMLAKLEPQFGLYSSFVGVVLYWIFGTSKDISIGPVAVLSTVVGNVVNDINSSGKEIPAHYIASALSIIAGSIILGIGLLRCGWIVDLISITSLSAFMTGSAITIAASQLPALLGVTGFSNRESPYKVVINTLKHLSEAKLDAAMGLTALTVLYLIRYTLIKAADKYPLRKRLLFFANTMRTVFVILLYTIISWLVNRNRRDSPAFNILGTVPTGVYNVQSKIYPSWIVALIRISR